MEDILRIYKEVVGILGILGNGLVCLVIWRVSALHTRTNAFIFHQAVVDFVGSVLTLLHSEVVLPDPLPDNLIGVLMCKMWFSNSLAFVFFVTSTFNLLALTMERYFAIVYPFKYQAAFFKYPRLKVGLAMTACWLVGDSVWCYGLVHFQYQNGKCVLIGESETEGILIVIAVFFVPVAVMLFAYIRTGVELKRGAVRVGPSSGQATWMAESLLKARRNTFKTLLIVFITFLVCWTPNQLIIFMFNFGFPLAFTEWYYLLSVALVATNSCVNPVIYAFKYQQFRKGLLGLVCGKCKRGGSSRVGAEIETAQSYQ